MHDRPRHPEDRTDRRVARTRAGLHRALVSLILSKGYDAITVEDICDAADIGRSTFYAHYTSKDDLKRRGLEATLHGMIQERARAGGHEGEPFDFSLPLLEHARDHLDLYRALAGGRGGAIALCSIRQILGEHVRDKLARAIPDQGPRDLAVQFVVGAFMAVLTWWLDGGARLPPQEVDAAFRRLATSGVG